MGRPLVRSKATAVVLGLVFTAAGLGLLYDAWEGRGGRTPWPIRVIAPW